MINGTDGGWNMYKNPADGGSMIFDTHAHYDDEAFDADREELLGSMEKNGIGHIINACSTWKSVSSTLELMEKYPFVYGALGIHPSNIEDMNEERFEKIRQLFTHPKAVAVGEIGLDYYWDKEEDIKKTQREWFSRQLALAGELKKPVVIHSREAAKDTYDVMAASGGADLQGVIHCFSYTKEMAREFLKWDYHFGIGGVITFKNARKLKEAVEYIPMDRILLETDCPYLAPEPNRGKRNSSLNLPYVAEAIAQLKGVTAQEVIEITQSNAKRLFGIQ